MSPPSSRLHAKRIFPLYFFQPRGHVCFAPPASPLYVFPTGQPLVCQEGRIASYCPVVRIAYCFAMLLKYSRCVRSLLSFTLGFPLPLLISPPPIKDQNFLVVKSPSLSLYTLPHSILMQSYLVVVLSFLF